MCKFVHHKNMDGKKKWARRRGTYESGKRKDDSKTEWRRRKKAVTAKGNEIKMRKGARGRQASDTGIC